ncbi:DUF1667 domain-containing protein [Diplocloster modestus]|nr:DUF1667 domain-containing protein [Diplocloster modestus]
MSMKKLTCIVCPNGCALTVEGDADRIRVTGNLCKRGEQFAKEELLHPVRTICTTVRTEFAAVPVLPVRVSAEIPKDRIKDVMQEINQVVLKEPVGRGDVIVPDVLGLGVDVIATSSLLRYLKKESTGKENEGRKLGSKKEEEHDE